MTLSPLPRLVGAALFAALVSSPSVLLAQATQPSATPVSADVSALMARGMAMFNERRYGEARQVFEEVVRREPTPQRWYAFGMAARNVSRYTQAIDAFEHFLAAPPANATPELLTEVRGHIAEMRQHLGTLTLTVTPATATPLLDGRPLALPTERVVLDPGAHVLEITVADHRPERREFSVDSGATVTLQITLAPVAREAPRLVIEPSVATAAVLLDGQSVGTGRVERSTTAGDHVIEIQANGYQPFRRPVHLGASGTTRIDATLTRQGLPGWVLPTAIAGGALAIGGTILGVWLATRDTSPELNPAWGTVME